VGERLKPPVLKTGVHFVDREFESRPLRQFRGGLALSEPGVEEEMIFGDVSTGAQNDLQKGT
jgi:hypothetical protein